MNYSEEIYYSVSKKGEAGNFPLILVHGAGGDHLHWGSEIRRMAGLDVYALDLSGHGQSEGTGEQDVTAYCEEIAAFLDRMSLEKVFLAGHSMGGAIAQTFAVNYPERLAGLILVSTGSSLPVNPDLLAQLKDTESLPGAIKMVVKWSFMKGTDPEILESAEKQLLSNRVGVVYGDYFACSKYDLSSEVGNFDLPVLVICGKSDRMTPVEFSKEISSSVKGSKLVVPDAGHMVITEKQTEVSKIVSDFIRKT